MLGFLKNLMKKSASDPAPAVQRVESPPPQAPRGAVPAPASSSPIPTVPSGETIQLPLNSILSRLPEKVQALITNRGAVLNLPISHLTPQLARGEVKITLAEFRQFTVPPAINVPADQSTATVSLPLSEILPRLKPGTLAKRDQRKVEVSSDVTDLFSRVDGATMISAPVFAPSPRNLEEVIIPAKPVEPLRQESLPATVEVSPAAAQTIAPPPQEEIPLAGIKPPAVESAPIKSNVVLPPPPPPASPPVLSSAPAPLPSDPAAATPEGHVAVAMSMMTSHFAATGKTEISNLHKATVAFPPEELEAALKRGKLSFPWSQVKGWIYGAAALPSLPSDTIIDFPLNVVAPIFMQGKRVVKPQKKVEAAASIPDLFARQSAPASFTPPPEQAPILASPEPAPLAMAEPAPAAAPIPVAPISAPAAAPAEAALPPRPVMDYGEIFGNPDRKLWTIQEILERIAHLRGVQAAVLATGDGLLIAGQWTHGVSPENAAGFAPSMFTRVAQYSKELKIGEPNQFTVLVEQTSLQIFRTGANYLMILGKPGEPLPKVQLSALALRMSQP